VGPSLAREAHLGSSGPITGGPDFAKIATMANLEAGAYGIFAKALLAATMPQPIDCKLEVVGVTDNASGLLDATLNLQLTVTLSAAADVTLSCQSDPENYSASDVSIIAIKLGSVSRQELTG
jgi:hypothetical protein